MRPRVSSPDPAPSFVATPNILADDLIPRVTDNFSALGPVRFFQRKPKQEDLLWADVLLVRTVTEVSGSLLNGSPVRWVGSASSGAEHLRGDELTRLGITWAHAPGCNAAAVAEYVLSAILNLPPRRGKSMLEQTVAIIGCGHVGTRLATLLEAVGLHCLLNDPPLAARGDPRPFVDLDVALQADIVSLHIPLTYTGRHATANLMDKKMIQQLRDDALLINTSRGGVIDEDALIARLGRDELRAAIDVWQEEPSINTRLADLAAIATPHIAGYSRLAKQRATTMLREALCRFIGRDTQPSAPCAEHNRRPNAAMEPTEPTILSATGAAALPQACRSVCDPLADTAALRSRLAAAPASVADTFQCLRKSYALRKEFSEMSFIVSEAVTRDRLTDLGFSVNCSR